MGLIPGLLLILVVFVGLPLLIGQLCRIGHGPQQDHDLSGAVPIPARYRRSERGATAARTR
jgi:hypothetical protein